MLRSTCHLPNGVRHERANVYIRPERSGRNVAISIIVDGHHRNYIVAPHPTELGRVALYDVTEDEPPNPARAIVARQME